MKKRRGYFITIYGINNIGKSTQVQLLVDFFKKNDWPAEAIKYPLYRLKPSGPYINQLLRKKQTQSISEEEFQMWYVINRFQYEPTLMKKINSGKIVIAEDYTGTGLSWGATKGADLEWLIEMNKPLVKEDLAILLDGERFLSGKETKHLHESKDAAVERCRRWHLKLAKMYNWHVVNANQAVDAVQEDILKVVSEFVGKHGKWS